MSSTSWKHLPRALALVACLGFAAPLDAPAPQTSVVVSFAAYASSDTIGFGEGARMRIDAIWIGLLDARLVPASSCKRDDATPVSGPLTVELVKRGARAETKVDATRYCGFEARLRRMPGKASGAPMEVRGASVLVSGRRSDGARFVIRSRSDAAPLLRARELDGFDVKAPVTRLILAVDVSRWMAGVDLSIAEAKEPGREREVVIDDKTNTDLLARFDANVESGFVLFEDRDGDRTLDVEERAHPIASRTSRRP